MVSEHIGWEWKWKKQLKGTLRGCLGYFHTSDFASRIYAYEPGLLYQMSFGSYYGEGIRYALVARSEIGSHLLLIAKLGTTDYFDRSHISSGLQEISRSSQSDRGDTGKVEMVRKNGEKREKYIKNKKY